MRRRKRWCSADCPQLRKNNNVERRKKDGGYHFMCFEALFFSLMGP